MIILGDKTDEKTPQKGNSQIKNDITEDEMDSCFSPGNFEDTYELNQFDRFLGSVSNFPISFLQQGSSSSVY